MCGIVGYVGKEQAAPILLEGLTKLEYRGYDSAGIAVRDGDSAPVTVKEKGSSAIPRAWALMRYRPYPLGDPRCTLGDQRASAPFG